MCVHLAPQRPGEPHALHEERRLRQGRLAVTVLERAYETLVLLRGYPPPARNGTWGGELVWYLERPPLDGSTTPPWGDEEAPASELVVSLEPLVSRGFDRAAAVCMGGAADLERSAHLCIAEASLAARAPAQGPHVRRAYATHLWWRNGRPGDADRNALRHLQKRPWAGVLGRALSERSEGAALWFDYLQTLEPKSRGTSAEIATTALHLAATRTRPGALRWHGSPDVTDVLRSSLGSREAVARFWDGFARHRALLGAGPGEPSPPDVSRWTKEVDPTIQTEAAWEITTSSLPRHLALPRPLEPTGSVFFVIEVDRPLAALALRASCEAPSSYVWSVARFDVHGRLLSTLLVPFQETRPIVEQRIVDLQQTRHLLVSGTNLGGIDLAHPFDPDHEPFEPHGCAVYFAALDPAPKRVWPHGLPD